MYESLNGKTWNKALYGTKQASRAWIKTITEALIAYGCIQCKFDRCVVLKRCRTTLELEFAIAVSTDDLMVMAYEYYWQQLLHHISAEREGLFKLSRHGPCTTFNGIEIKIDKQD